MIALLGEDDYKAKAVCFTLPDAIAVFLNETAFFYFILTSLHRQFCLEGGS